MTRRVVVTGVGMVTPVGNDAKTAFDALLAGRNGVGPITRIADVSDLPVRISAEVKNFDPTPAFENPKDVPRNDIFIQFIMVAGTEAMAQAGLAKGSFDPERAGSVIGVGLGGVLSIQTAMDTLREKGPRRVSPFFVPSTIANLAPGQLSMKYDLRGPTWAPASACASGGHAIGESFETIRRGRCDLMLTGGAEAAIAKVCVAGFAQMRALSTRNDDPEHASRPFDQERDGFVMGEGAGVLVLEELEHAKRRGANILCELVGYGATSDAYHITAPAPEGEGAQRCMREALQEAQLNPDDIDYINAHGTSTELNDALETVAIKKVFGDHAHKVWISSTKSMIGHLLGGAGGVEAVVSVLSLVRSAVHPTRNLLVPDPECDLDYVPNTAREKKLRAVLSNSFGFGGTNAAVLFKQYGAN